MVPNLAHQVYHWGLKKQSFPKRHGTWTWLPGAEVPDARSPEPHPGDQPGHLQEILPRQTGTTGNINAPTLNPIP